MNNKQIHLKGVREHNLKDIELKIPYNKLIVITGVSGSGKSSLAFDTLYAEGQRRYVESLSSYARQFLGRMSKPEVDFIKGIPPAIAIAQKVNSGNSRSTVGTSTEIYEYIRLLFARIGHIFSPISQKEVKRETPEDIIELINNYPVGLRYALYAPFTQEKERTLEGQLKALLLQGINRIEVEEKLVRLEDALLFPDALENKKIALLIDRLEISHTKESLNRLFESAEKAFFHGHGACFIKLYATSVKEFHFSNKLEADGITFEEPSDLLFNFNSPIGACPTCNGLGSAIGIDPNLVIPNPSLSLYEDCVVAWKGAKMSEYKKQIIRNAEFMDFPIHKPYRELTKKQKDLIWKGCDYWEGLDAFFEMLKKNLYKIQYRVMYSRYRGKTVCPTCNGSRLKPSVQNIKIGNKSIVDLILKPIDELKTFFNQLDLPEHEYSIAKRLLTEITTRLDLLIDVGLEYLTLNRASATLSGGESQRINLVTNIGSTLMGSLYILDEPSIGLHMRDNKRLIQVLKELRNAGNTVIVVEHDEEIMREADYIIDIGPDAGRYGGEVVYQGDLSNIQKGTKSHTLRYLLKEETIPVPQQRRKWTDYLEIKHAQLHNLKDISVKFPLNVMTVVTGVSGSGKSTLVKDILYRQLKAFYDNIKLRIPLNSELKGATDALEDVLFVDQNPIGKSSRSNAVTYLKVFDEIRSIFASRSLAMQTGLSARDFSFNQPGGRCEHCKGEGVVTIPMQFMADIKVTCEYCNGKCYQDKVLDILYHGRNIYDLLQMSVNEAIELFESEKQVSLFSSCKIILNKLRTLQEVGLGYIKLGQSSSTLSGGENQRLKLASFIEKKSHYNHKLFIFDEPTTGLHFHDIAKLLKAFDKLIKNGHSVLIIEHNMEIIKSADYIIDLGPEGGKKGGSILVSGTPEEVAQCKESYTGQFLKKSLES